MSEPSALRPQLSGMLGDVAATVCEFTELMPAQLMEELCNDIKESEFSVALTHVPGFAKVVARLDLTEKKKEKTCAVEASILCYGQPPETPYIAKFQAFPHTPQGVKETRPLPGQRCLRRVPLEARPFWNLSHAVLLACCAQSSPR